MVVLNTTMRLAFARIPVPALVAPLGDRIIRSLTKGSGQYKPKRCWNASLSYRTHQKLVHTGFMPQS
ncbi:hypothetical protein A7981_05570 [Methylovorus sp. MM2]|uniref:hypothetical protein n=1 Tax=Methylovorus sp. MM2 TaxID=1848038 RepID=UPI0007DEB445|nr:hypothetical protein [Methylovorus sp. MM2]OAM52907.1 hypothetical protein A7981_05570 [Methylovorus sp. MM2]